MPKSTASANDTINGIAFSTIESLWNQYIVPDIQRYHSQGNLTISASDNPSENRVIVRKLCFAWVKRTGPKNVDTLDEPVRFLSDTRLTWEPALDPTVLAACLAMNTKRSVQDLSEQY